MGSGLVLGLRVLLILRLPVEGNSTERYQYNLSHLVATIANHSVILLTSFNHFKISIKSHFSELHTVN